MRAPTLTVLAGTWIVNYPVSPLQKLDCTNQKSMLLVIVAKALGSQNLSGSY
jgi:hypothetical protein